MKPLYKALLLGAFTGILGLIFCRVFIVYGIDKKVDLDLLFTMRGQRQAPSDVIIVSIDKRSSDKLNQEVNPEKWQRSLHAPLIDNLVKAGASAIVFDMFFYEKNVNDNKLIVEANKRADKLLAEAIRHAGNVVITSLLNEKKIEQGGVITHIEELKEPVDCLVSPSAAVAPFPLPKRHASNYWTFNKKVVDTPTLPVVAYQLFTLNEYDEFINLLQKFHPHLPEQLLLNKDKIVSSNGFNAAVLAIKDIIKDNPSVATKMLNELEIPGQPPRNQKTKLILKTLIHMYQPPYRRYLNYYGPPGTIKTIPYYQILEPQDKSGKDLSEFNLNNKVIFVGASAKESSGQKDGFYTVFSDPDGLDLSGVEIAATAFANILEDMPVRALSWDLYITTILLFGLILGVLCYMFPTVISAPGAVAVIVLYFISASYQFKTAGIWYPLVVPLFIQAPLSFIASIVLKYINTARERKNIKKAFRHYLPDELVDKLAKNLTSLKTHSKQVHGTCLATDAEQYTTLSETLDPSELRDIINNYFDVIFKPIKQNGGMVSNVLADSVMATWITTQTDTESRKHACLSAIDIDRAVHRFNQPPNDTPLPTRIGLHSGKIILGSVGAGDHYEYRPVGDIVNTATRIEGLNKYLGTRISVSEEVLYGVDIFLTRELGQFLLKGKKTPLTIHELICIKDEADEHQINLCASFSEALSAYRNQSWKEAIAKFSKINERYGEDGPSLFYIRQCEQCYEKPFEESWTGVVRMDKK